MHAVPTALPWPAGRAGAASGAACPALCRPGPLQPRCLSHSRGRHPKTAWILPELQVCGSKRAQRGVDYPLHATRALARRPWQPWALKNLPQPARAERHPSGPRLGAAGVTSFRGPRPLSSSASDEFTSSSALDQPPSSSGASSECEVLLQPARGADPSEDGPRAEPGRTCEGLPRCHPPLTSAAGRVGAGALQQLGQPGLVSCRPPALSPRADALREKRFQ